MYEYSAIVTKEHDGDTIKVDVDLGFGVWWKDVDLRLMGLNAPELDTVAGKIAQTALATHLPLGTSVVIRTEKDKQEKYGRYLATIIVGDLNINQWLLDNGYAKAWDGKGVRPV